MLAGNARIAAVNNYGKNFIADVARATAGGRSSRLRFMSPHLQQNWHLRWFNSIASGAWHSGSKSEPQVLS
jgi:hypothetical protein